MVKANGLFTHTRTHVSWWTRVSPSGQKNDHHIASLPFMSYTHLTNSCSDHIFSSQTTPSPIVGLVLDRIKAKGHYTLTTLILNWYFLVGQANVKNVIIVPVSYSLAPLARPSNMVNQLHRWLMSLHVMKSCHHHHNYIMFPFWNQAPSILVHLYHAIHIHIILNRVA